MRVFLLPFGLFPFAMLAQCGMTVSPPMEAPACTSTMPEVWVSFMISGGVPPYTVQYNNWTGWQSWTEFSGSVNHLLYSCPSVQDCAVQNFTGGVVVLDANGCSTSNATACCTGYFAGPFEVNTMTRTVTSDCVTGIHTVTFPTNPSIAAWNGSVELSYVLGRNGQVHASGLLGTVLLSNPQRIAFQNLPGGDYTLTVNYDQGVAVSPPRKWCPSSTSTSFYLPGPGDCGTNFRMRSALGGALPSGTLMTDGLRPLGLVPTTEPYSALGYGYVSTSPGVSLMSALLNVTGNDAIVDWVVVEVRQPSSPFTVLHSQPALIQRDGDVIDPSGATYLNTSLVPGQYRFGLRHRNHLGIMTSVAGALEYQYGLMMDLRTINFIHGTNPTKLVGAVRCLWPGDVNFDGTAKYAGSANDRDPILTLVGGSTPTNTANNVYNGADLNLDGKVKYAGSANDRDIILQTIGGSVPTATRIQQIP